MEEATVGSEEVDMVGGVEEVELEWWRRGCGE